MIENVIALRDRVTVARSGEYMCAELHHGGQVFTLTQHVGPTPMDQTVKTVSGILAAQLAAEVWRHLLASVSEISHDNRDATSDTEGESMAQTKWLTPKRSKEAKAHGESHGHKFGRLNVKDDAATAKCKNDGCAVTLHVTENEHELVPDDNGVISCGDGQVESAPEQPESHTAAGMTQAPTADDLLMRDGEVENLRSTGSAQNPDLMPVPQVSANDVLFGHGNDEGADARRGEHIFVTDHPDGSGAPRSPFALELPPAPQTSREITLANGETWLPERDLIDTISDAIINHPRSQQQLIGPSEIGTKCDRCLGKKLMGVPQTRDVAWLPQVGTAVHDWLDQVLTECESCGWITERKVTVGIIGNRVIRGRCDAYKNGVVVDFKIVGANTLKTVAASGPSPVYRVQDHLYGRGYELDGYEVTHVALLYLPRSSPTLADAKLHLEPYDRGIALAALDRAQRIQEFVEADKANVLQLDRDPACYDCGRMQLLPGEDPPSSGPRAGNPFAGIL